MKKISNKIFLLMILILLTSCTNTQNEERNFQYQLSYDQTYYIITDLGTYNNPEVIIPATYKGLPVKEIGEEAFGQYGHITSVVLGENITIIRKKAFYYCRGLTEIYIPETVMLIENNAFDRCYNLTINCQAEKRPTYFESNWNGHASVVWGYLIEIPELDPESARVKALLEEKYKLIDEIQKGSYSLTCVTQYDESTSKTVIEKKFNDDYFIGSYDDDESIYSNQTYYHKIDYNTYALYDVYESYDINNNIINAYQCTNIYYNFPYYPQDYNFLKMFSPLAVYKEIDNKIVVEDRLARIDSEYGDSFGNIKYVFDSEIIIFTFDFFENGYTVTATTSNEYEIVEVKFEKINEIEELNFDEDLEHGTEIDPLCLKQYLRFDELYRVPNIIFDARKDRYFKIKLTPGYYCVTNTEFEIQDKDFNVIDFEYEVPARVDVTIAGRSTGFLVTEEMDVYFVIPKEYVKYLDYVAFIVNKYNEIPEVSDDI